MNTAINESKAWYMYAWDPKWYSCIYIISLYLHLTDPLVDAECSVLTVWPPKNWCHAMCWHVSLPSTERGDFPPANQRVKCTFQNVSILPFPHENIKISEFHAIICHRTRTQQNYTKLISIPENNCVKKMSIHGNIWKLLQLISWTSRCVQRCGQAEPPQPWGWCVHLWRIAGASVSHHSRSAWQRYQSASKSSNFRVPTNDLKMFETRRPMEEWQVLDYCDVDH